MYSKQALHEAIVKTAHEARREAMRFLHECQDVDLSKLSDNVRKAAVDRTETAERIVDAYQSAESDEELEAAMDLHGRLLPTEVERCVRQTAGRVLVELDHDLQRLEKAGGLRKLAEMIAKK